MKIVHLLFLSVLCHTSPLLAIDSDVMQKPEFRIISPQFMCNTKNTNRSVEASPEEITIRFQPREGRRLTYLVRVYFQFIDGWKSQRRTISLWRSIRLLEKRIRNISEEISLNNQFNINQTELTPGVIYTFNIAGRDSNAVLSEEENVTVVYRNSQESGRKGVGDLSLLLIGSVYIYNHLPFILQANLILCQPTNDYFFKWKVSGLEDEYKMWLRTPGKTLYLPPNILSPSKSYMINVEVSNINQTLSYTRSTMKLRILTREFFAILTPRNLSVGINRKITYKLSISQMDVEEYSLEISWECENLQNQTACLNFEEESTTKLEISFGTSGTYRVCAVITYKEFTQTLSSYVTVDPRIVASVQFPDLKPRPLISWRALRIPVVVNNVIPHCSLHWVTINGTEDRKYGFIESSYFNTKVIPDLEENFLSDIVEISNATYSEDFPLFVDAQSDSFPGIEPETTYIFRLNIVCPEPIQEWDSENVGNVSSFADLILMSKQPPLAETLKVEPEEGVALKTKFRFMTGMATDTADDYPLRYSFQYQINEILVDLDEFYENMEMETELPYSEEPLRTFYQVCDTRGACSRLEGPRIRVNMIETILKDEFLFKIDKLKFMFHRTDYGDVFSNSIACIYTFKAMPDATYYKKLKSELFDLIQMEVKRLQGKNEEIFISEQKILNFVKYGKILADLFDFKNAKFTENLLNLLKSIPQERSDEYGFINENYVLTKRSIEPDKAELRELSDEDLLMKGILELELLETMISSLNHTENSTKIQEIKRNFTQQVRDFVGNLLCCSLQLSSDYSFVSGNFSLHVFRGNGRQIQLRNLSLPSSKDQPDSGYVILRDLYETEPTAEYCVSRISYNSDFITDTLRMEEILDISLFAIDPYLKYTEIQEPSMNSEKYSVISLRLQPDTGPDETMCAIWNGRNWTDEYCEVVKITPSNIDCHCFMLGFLKLISHDPGTEEFFDNVTVSTPRFTQIPGTSPSTSEVPEESFIEEPPIDYYKTSDVSKTETFIVMDTAKPKTKMVSAVFTFSPIVNNERADEVITVATSTLTNQSDSSNNPNIKESGYATMIGFIVIGIFCLIIIIILSVNLYFIRKKKKMKHLQEIQIMSTETRTQSEEIKYARFYDEQTLGNHPDDNYL
ncbi:hypothetical protein DMENIID0001_074940 [Sergentomyia squamirostris]